MSIPKSFMGRCCTNRFYLDKCDCDKDKTMRVGDRVKLSDSANVIDFIRDRFHGAPGIVQEIFSNWEPHDIICWDVSVKTIDENDRECLNGFYFNDLIVIEYINGQEMRNDSTCERCMSIAYDPMTGS